MGKKQHIPCRLQKEGKIQEVVLEVEQVIAMGFTARDEETMKKNLAALADLNIQAPSKMPAVYPCLLSVLEWGESIQVVGEDTCGEVEYLLILQPGKIYIGVGSDHADKAIESVSIIKSKQLCGKHMALDLWDYEDVREHWDKLVLESYYTVEGKNRLYQQGTVEQMKDPQAILQAFREEYPQQEKAILFSGSITNKTGFLYGEHFRYKIIDPIGKREIQSEYRIDKIG